MSSRSSKEEQDEIEHLVSYLQGTYQDLERGKEDGAALDQGVEVLDEFQELVEALECKCVNLKCQCSTENGTNLPATLEKLAAIFYHPMVMQKRPSRKKFVRKSENTMQLSPLRVETIATAIGCECVNSRCQCTTDDGLDSLSALNGLMAILDQMNIDMVKEEAVFQESLAVKMRRFFHDGFERIKQTFTRRPH